MRRVVITGLGTVNPLGNDVETFFQRALEGRSGVGRITRFDASEHTVQIGAFCALDLEAHPIHEVALRAPQAICEPVGSIRRILASRERDHLDVEALCDRELHPAQRRLLPGDVRLLKARHVDAEAVRA